MALFSFSGRELLEHSNQEEVQTLYDKLRDVESHLLYTERRGMDEGRVKDVMKLTYEAEDVLDEWVALIAEEAGDGGLHPWEKVLNCILCLCLCFKRELRHRDITQKMKDLIGRLAEFYEEWNISRHLLHKKTYEFHSEMSGRRAGATTSHIHDDAVVGRGYEKDSLVNKLVPKGEDDDDDESDTQVISIVGFGGIGKTSLAQLAFNDPKVISNFTLRIWICVPNPFDPLAVARNILEQSVGGISTLYGISTLESLLGRIKEILWNEKFLIVLDDVWTEDRWMWEPFRSCLRGAPGSRILVTTRNERVAKMMGSSHVQELSEMSVEDCWKILSTTALRGRSEKEKEKLKDVGVDIARKCHGLPLAARMLGNTLAYKTTVIEWRDVLNSLSKGHYEDEVSSGLFSHIRLSYDQLNPLLRRCFLISCIVYPKDTRIYIDELIRIWTAYGCLRSSAVDDARLEGRKHWTELAARSFFQDYGANEDEEGIASFRIHDMMHDFATHLSRSEPYLLLEGGSRSPPIGNKTHDIILRTFCARHVSEKELFSVSHSIDLLRGVHVLIMSDCNLEHVPEEVGNLFHLRYLDLSHNPLAELPESVGNLYFLQTMSLENCRRLISLPRGIKKLINLKHLLTSNTESLVQLPHELQYLTDLWTLGEVVVTRNSGSLAILRNLNKLGGALRLVVEGLDEKEDVDEAKKACLIEKIGIRNFDLIFHYTSVDVMEALLPPQELKTLLIEGSGASRCPTWIIPSHFFDLRNLVIVGFVCDSGLPPLGELPRLENLELRDMEFTYLTHEFFGTTYFPKLKKLEFDNCRSWIEWKDTEQEASTSTPPFPLLEKLSLKRCPRLKALPHNLFRTASSLKSLSIIDCFGLRERYDSEFQGKKEEISYIPHIDMDGNPL